MPFRLNLQSVLCNGRKSKNEVIEVGRRNETIETEILDSKKRKKFFTICFIVASSIVLFAFSRVDINVGANNSAIIRD